MKKLLATACLLVFSNLLFSVWYSSNQNLNSGTYSDVGWGSSVLTINANQNVLFTGNTNFSSGSLTIKAGATLTINQASFQANGSILLETGATLIISGSLTNNNSITVNGGTLQVGSNWNNSSNNIAVSQGGIMTIGGAGTMNGGGLTIGADGKLVINNLTLNGNNTINGTLEVTNQLQINGGLNTMGTCSEIRTKILKTSNANVITGSGYVHISTTYDNQGNIWGYTGQALTNNNNVLVNYTGAATTNSFGSATLTTQTTNPCMVVLPVVFNAFSASPDQNGHLYLNWNANETAATDHYEIQVSTDGENFETVEVLNASSNYYQQYQYKLKF